MIRKSLSRRDFKPAAAFNAMRIRLMVNGKLPTLIQSRKKAEGVLSPLRPLVRGEPVMIDGFRYILAVGGVGFVLLDPATGEPIPARKAHAQTSFGHRFATGCSATVPEIEDALVVLYDEVLKASPGISVLPRKERKKGEEVVPRFFAKRRAAEG